MLSSQGMRVKLRPCLHLWSVVDEAVSGGKHPCRNKCEYFVKLTQLATFEFVLNF